MSPSNHRQVHPLNNRGSAGNVLAALASFVYPGLGQLAQGRYLSAFVFFALATLLWFVMLGWLIHLWATLDAACYAPEYDQ
jgi:TM2 domain-containing membrane protein YozV